ncbi:MAG: hypothetical protein EXR08_10105 [Alphaproteobacteria bacterium]|nr:hypothetical protein [Alphaproteobacteria bacterium]
MAILRHWRLILRLGGGLALVVGLLFLLADLHVTGGGPDYRPSALGEVWHRRHAPSLNLLQAVVERYVLPQLWTYVLLPTLLSPAWIVAGMKGVVLIALSYVRISRHKAESPSR